MRVVIDPVWIVRILTWLQLQKQLSRTFNTIAHDYLFTLSMHVDKRDLLFSRHRTNYSGILSMSVVELSFHIETSSHHRREQDRIAFFASHIFDEPDQIATIIFRRCVSLALLFR